MKTSQVAEHSPTGTETAAEPTPDSDSGSGSDPTSAAPTTSSVGSRTDSPTAGAVSARSRPAVSVLVAAGVGIVLLIAAAVTGIALNSAEQTANSTSAADESTGPVLLVPVDAPQATSVACADLVKNLPQALPNAGSTLARRPLGRPVQAGAAVWGAGDNPVVLRCGVTQPPEFTATSELLAVSGVQWLQITGDDGAATWYAVDRSACIALTLPSGLGTGPIQEVSAAISAVMPAVPIHPTGG